MSRSQLDQFIDDDEEETCPLCVEEFDLTDKGFRPCPCGYQICQFCYHNVKTNMNGLCPACRRPYKDGDIEYKVITSEETAAHRARQAQKQKKTQAALQKEKQKAEADNLSRKHLAGMRVVQKNLVYVTGLSPTTQEDQLLQTLRGDQYFGQYGEIIKIVVSKAKDPSHPHSVGVYVTYKRKEDAASCITAVDGSKNGDRTLRAQFGTTKYCSAYLRGETCTNRNCMFLHEPGEANESYSRADLSALNAGSSQHGHGKPPPPQSQQPVSAAQPMARQGSDQPSSPQADRPALPSTASWASKAPQSSRAESLSTTTTLGSPAPVVATPAPTQPESEPVREAEPEVPTQKEELQPSDVEPATKLTRRPQVSPLVSLIRGLHIEDFKLVWSSACLSPADLDIINNYPPLFDQNGGARRRLRRQREDEQRRLDHEAQAFQQTSAVDQDDNPEMSGSLQLGGEPEERQSVSQVQSAIQPPGQEGGLDQRFPFAGSVSSPGISDHGMTPQQQQQMLLQTLKPSSPSGYHNNTNNQGSFQPANPQQQTNAPPGHQRNVSRFSFANDSSASAAVKPVANAKLMNQQSSMMPPAGSNHYGAQHQQQTHGSFYTSNVQGPPPGLKTTGTPPVSGNLTFGQGHGFATGGLQYGAGTSRNQQDNYYRELLRGRDGAGGSSVDAKHDSDFPPLGPSRQHSITSRVSLDESRRSTPPVPPGFESQHPPEAQRSTPTVPSALPNLEGPSSSPASRASSRASLRRAVSHITTALPLRPGTPARFATPSKESAKEGLEVAATPSKERANGGAEVAASPETPVGLDKTALSTEQQVTAVKTTASGGAAHKKSDEVKLESGIAAPTKLPETAGHVTSTQKQEAESVALPLPRKEDLSISSDGQSGLLGQTSEQRDHESVLAGTSNKPDSKQQDAQKRKHPGKLDITAAVKQQADDQPVLSTVTPIESAAANKSLPAPAHLSSTKPPESPNVASPAIKTAPRTLRVVSTPKAETPPTVAPSTLPNVVPQRLPSRQPSVASINPPGTPSSEQVSISDNISMTSTSQSRANSPPPSSSKIGTAPVRAKTKNQLRKERQERAKVIEVEKVKTNEVVKPSSDEPAQEAIVSRKKKTKKEKEAKVKAAATAQTTPTVSRPASPAVPVVESPVKPETPAADAYEQPRSATPTRSPPVPTAGVRSPAEPSPPPTPTLTAAQLITELKASTPELQRCIDSLFRVSNSHHFKTPQNVAHKDLLHGWRSDVNVKLSKDEVEALLHGKIPAVRRGGDDSRTFDRHMISPSGAHLRALTRELEGRFLELEQALREMPEEFRFRPSKPQNEIRLPGFDLEEMKRKMDNAGGRGVSVMEQMVQDGSTMKKGAFLVDEASKYINEFVMPPATPPPSAGGQARVPAAAQGSQPQHGELAVPSVEIAERQLNEARRIADEKENALRKMIKKNKRMLGLSS